MTEQLVLRFRDIERPLGDTIRLHQDLITSAGATWWGWLYRTYEVIPTEYLSRIGLPSTIFLFDTGQALIYRCDCEEIVIDSAPERSPDVALTPSYYNSRPAPAWFRITQITEVDSSDLLGTTCVMLPSAGPDCAVDLVGAKVTRLGDLRRQEVTMWVLEREG